MIESFKKSPIVYILSVLVLLMGVTDIVSAVTPAIPERVAMLRPLFSFTLRSTVRLGTVLIGLALIFLSNGLRKRGKAAWLISVIILAISFIFHLIKGFDFEEAIITTGILVALIYERKYFTAGFDYPSVVQGVKGLVFGFLFTSLYGVLGIYILEHHRGQFILTQAFSEVAKMFFLLEAPEGINPGLASIFVSSIYIIGFSTLLYSIFMFFRPAIFRSIEAKENLDKAKILLKQYSKYSLQTSFLLFNKNYFFNSKENAFIAYKESGSYTLVLGMPVGPEESMEATIGEFIDFCQSRGRKPVFFNIEPENLKYFQKYKYKNIEFGSEAFVFPETFSIEGGWAKHLRQALKKMDSLGYSTKVYNENESQGILWRLREISNQWLECVHGSEKKFTVGKFDEKYLLASKIIVLMDKTGHISAFVNFNSYGNRSLAIDLMRHEQGCLPETMVCLFLKLIYWAKENGYTKISLGDASLYGIGGKGRPLTEKALKLVFDRFNNFYNFKGLYTFKSKFNPVWEKRYLVYPSIADLGPSLVALLLADSSQGLGKDLILESKKMLLKR